MQSVIGWVGQSQELKIQGLHSNAEERIAYLKAAPLSSKSILDESGAFKQTIKRKHLYLNYF